MKLYRGDRDEACDSKTPDEYLLHPWQPDRGAIVRLDATISGIERLTSVRLLIEAEDVVALFIAFLKADPQGLFTLLSDHLKARDQEIEKLRKSRQLLRGELCGLRRHAAGDLQQEIDGILSRERESK